MPPKHVTLLHLVQDWLLPAFLDQGLRLMRFADSVPEGPIDLEVEELCIRIERERTFVDVEFRARHDPQAWFLSVEVLTFLGVATDDGLATLKELETLAALEPMLRLYLPTLAAAFAKQEYPETYRRLMEIRRTRNLRISPSSAPHSRVP